MGEKVMCQANELDRPCEETATWDVKMKERSFKLCDKCARYVSFNKRNYVRRSKIKE